MIVRFVYSEKNIVCIGADRRIYVASETLNYYVLHRKTIINDTTVFYDLFIRQNS